MADEQGTVKIGTELNEDGLKKGLNNVGSLAQKGFGVMGKTAQAATDLAVKGIMAAEAAVAGFSVSTINTGKEFTAQMSKVAAISGAAGDEIEALKQKAIEMGGASKFSATEAAQGLEYMAMAGWKTDDMLNGLKGVMDLAAASGEDLAATSDIVTDAMTAFGMKAEESTHFADVLAQASTNANTNVAMMGETFKYVAPVAGSMGYNIEDTAIAIGLMANSGIKASQAGTALRSIITRLSTDAGASSEKLGALGVLTEELGVQFFNTDGSARALNDVLSEARVKWQDLSQEEQAVYGKQIAGQEALSGWLAIMNAAPADIDKLTDSINNSTDAAANMAATMADNLQGDLTSLSSKFETLKIAIYDGMDKPLRDVAQLGIKYIEELTTAFNDGGTEKLVGAFGDIIADFTGKATQFAPDMIDLGVSVLNSFLEGIHKNSSKITTGALNIVDSLAAGISSVLPNLGTVGLDIAETLAQNLPDMIEEGATLVERLAEGFTQSLPALGECAGSIIESLAIGFAEYAPDILNVGITIVQNIIDGIGQGLPLFLSYASELLQSFAGIILSRAPDLINSGLLMIQNVSAGVANSMPTIVQTMANLATGLVATLVEHIPRFIETGKEVVFNLIDGIVESLPGLLNSAIEIISTCIAGIEQNLPKVVGMGLDIVFKLISGLIKALPSLVAAVPKLVMAIVNGIKSFSWLDLGLEIIKSLILGITRMVKSVWDVACDIGKTVLDAIKGFSLKDAGKNLVEGLWNGINDKVKWIKDKIKGFGEDVIDGFKDIFEIHSPSRRMEKEIGVYLPPGIDAGIEEKKPELIQHSEKLVDDTVDAMRNKSMRAKTFVSAMQGKAFSTSNEAANEKAELTRDSQSDASDTAVLEIDYDKMAEANAKALNNTEFKVGDREFARLVRKVVPV